MPVKFFYTQHVQPQTLLKGSTPEAFALMNILRQLQSELAEHHSFHAVIVNSENQELPADMVIVADHGLGILNLQHEPGTISRDKDVWCANGQPVTINARIGYRNPHEKVQRCAEIIREKLLKPPQPNMPWLQGRPITWQDLFFDSAVCFTHPDAEIELFRKFYDRELSEGQHTKEWERFTLLERDEIPRWVRELSFEKEVEAILSVQSYRLTSAQIMRIVTDLFKAAELPEIPAPMPPKSKTVGFLLLKEHGEITARFQLDLDQATLGRDHSCDLLIPKNFINVSRVHARIFCQGNGVVFEDCSRNGTFINGDKVHGPIKLQPGQELILGGNKPTQGVCVLEFVLA